MKRSMKLLRDIKESLKMASKKTPKKSGFNAPTIGTVHPKGSKIVQLPNGRIKIVEPKKKK